MKACLAPVVTTVMYDSQTSCSIIHKRQAALQHVARVEGCMTEIKHRNCNAVHHNIAMVPCM